MRLVLIGLIFLSHIAIADTEIETIQLQHRMAADVLPHVQAVIPETATVRAYGDKLIIKADRATIANVIELLKQIDVAQRSVLVTVLRTSSQLSNNKAAKNQVDLTLGNKPEAAVQIKRWSTNDAKNKDQQFKVRGIAGYPLTISIGQDVPQKDYLVFKGPRGGVGVQQSTSYISADNGFKALPELLPDQQVRVEIYPFFASIARSDGSIDRSELLTTIIGPVGQWLEVGLITDQQNQQGNGSTTYSSYTSNQQYLYLKIETNSN